MDLWDFVTGDDVAKEIDRKVEKKLRDEPVAPNGTWCTKRHEGYFCTYQKCKCS